MLAGLPDYVVRNAKWDDRLATSSFWFQLSLGTLLGGLSLAVGFGLRGLGLLDIGSVVIALAPVYLIDALSSMSQASLRHAVRFAPIAVAGVAGAFAGAAASVWVVLAGGGFWALVAGRLASSVASSLSMVALAGWRPAAPLSLAGLRPALGFSLRLAGGRLLGVLNVKASDLIVGFVGGPALLGAYQLAVRPLNLVLQAVLGQIQTVALSAFSPLEGRDEIRAAVLGVLKAAAFVVFPLAAGLSATAPEFVRLVFGEQWDYLALPAAILLLAGLPATVNYLLSPVLVKLDRPGDVLRFAATLTLIGTTFTAISAGWGLVAVAWAFLARTLIGMVIACSMLVRRADVRLGTLALALLHPFAGALLVWLAVGALRQWLPAMPVAQTAACLVGAGVLAYAVVMAPLFLRDGSAIAAGLQGRLRRGKA
jgi:O-antigen/teichoic acid export membrane protein